MPFPGLEAAYSLACGHFLHLQTCCRVSSHPSLPSASIFSFWCWPSCLPFLRACDYTACPWITRALFLSQNFELNHMCKIFDHVRQYMHRFWGLGHGHLWGGGLSWPTISPLSVNQNVQEEPGICIFWRSTGISKVMRSLKLIALNN